MRLRDHFHQPLSPRRRWNAFYNAWATAIAWEFNRRLPEGFFAEPNVHFGIEIEVAAWDESQTPTTDVVEVAVYGTEGGSILLGAVEIISPANKDRQAHREAFVAKSRAYLQDGVGLMLVDIVTDRQGNLHDDLLAAGGRSPQSGAKSSANLYASAYRPVEPAKQAELEVWFEVLRLGGALPLLPLWLREGPCMWVDLSGTYQQTCREMRID